jgi:methyl-accepting chemotaxis protein
MIFVKLNRKINVFNNEKLMSMSSISKLRIENAMIGQDSVKSMIVAINEITDSNHNIMNEVMKSNKEISEIISMITEIGNKIKIINDIVFQSKLLAFNAAEEAARVGEEGKGFVFVAEEMGHLAQISEDAAIEITEMLKESFKIVEEIVNCTKLKVENLTSDGKIKVEIGIKIAQDCGEMLDDIFNNITFDANLAKD